MIADSKGRIKKILDALAGAAAGDYSTVLDPVKRDDDLGLIENAVNLLLSKLNQNCSSPLHPGPAEEVRRYRHMLDNMQESYFEVDLKGTLQFFNDRVIYDLGYSREELRGLSFKQLMDEFNAEKVVDVFHRVFVTGKPIKNFDCVVLKKNGGAIDVEASVSLIKDNREQPAGFRGIVRDVSERKAAETELRKNREKYRKILEEMEETYMETDLQGNLVFFNDAFCRLLGYSREELQNANYRKINPSEETRKKVFYEYNEIYRTGKPKYFSTSETLCKDGSIKKIESTISLQRSPEGEPIGFCGVGRDITERMKTEKKIKDNERHLRLITDNIRDIIWTMDFELNVTYLSPSVTQIFGFTPEEITHLPLHALVPNTIYEEVKKTVVEELAKEDDNFQEKKEVRRIELELLHKDGSPVWVEISADFNRDESGKPFEIVGVTRDITERKRAEAALRESEQRYRMIVENIHDSISLLDLNFNYLYISPSEVRITGYEPEELMKIPPQAQAPPETYNLLQKIFVEEMEREFSGEPVELNRTRTVEVEIYHKNGGTIWVELIISFMRDGNGKPNGILMSARDITLRKGIKEELKESEKRYRMIVENMQDIIWVMDFDFKYKYRSPSNNDITGRTPEEIMSIPAREQMTPESYALVESPCRGIEGRIRRFAPRSQPG